MGYFNLMILLSRYIFAGFSILFIIVAFTFMKPFFSYSMGTRREKNKFLSLSIYFFHLAGIAILMGKEAEDEMKLAVAINGLVVMAIFFIAFMILKLMKRHNELIIWQLMFFLMDIGYLMIERLNHDLATKQIEAYIIGTVIALIFPSIFSIIIKPRNMWIYLGVLIVTMLLPFVAGTTLYGATNWVKIGPISFQPSEIGKVAMVLFLASVLSEEGRLERGIKGLIFPGGVIVFSLLCLVIQKDLGAAVLYYVTAIGLLFVATKKLFYPIISALAAGVGGLGAYIAFGHVRVRVAAWLNPWADISGIGYQSVQGLFAIGTWGWLGSGLTRGKPSDIPFAYSDYIFAAVCEEFGNVVGVIVLLAYLGIIFLCLQVAFRYEDNFYRLVIMGIATLFAVQTFIIVGGVLKVIPLTGITTPFMSAGGSSIVVSMGMIGLITYFSYKARVIAAKEQAKTKEGA